MHLFRETFLLFSLNILDAILTIVWVRNGVATEGNQIMARLLDNGLSSGRSLGSDAEKTRDPKTAGSEKDGSGSSALHSRAE